MSAQHPGFAAMQNKIAAKAGVGKKAAGAILASKTREAAPAAKKANPRLRRVKPAANQPRSQAHGIMRNMLNGPSQDD